MASGAREGKSDLEAGGPKGGFGSGVRALREEPADKSSSLRAGTCDGGFGGKFPDPDFRPVLVRPQ